MEKGEKEEEESWCGVGGPGRGARFALPMRSGSREPRMASGMEMSMMVSTLMQETMII